MVRWNKRQRWNDGDCSRSVSQYRKKDSAGNQGTECPRGPPRGQEEHLYRGPNTTTTRREPWDTATQRAERNSSKQKRTCNERALPLEHSGGTHPECCRGNRPLMTVTIERVVEKWVGNVDNQLYANGGGRRNRSGQKCESSWQPDRS